MTHRLALRLFAATVVLAGALGACASNETGREGAAAVSPPSASTTTTPSVAPTVTAAPTMALPTTVVPSTEPPPPVYAVTVAPIDDVLASRMVHTWRPGCPVPLTDLRYLTVHHWGYDGAVHDGELVVHADHADAVATAFGDLFAARFPVERMRLVDDYAGDDDASMRDNNTSAFNCREVDGRPGVLSAHAFGAAIDVNPLVNPWVRGDVVDPPEGAPYAVRDPAVPGLIVPGDAAVRAFAAIGWGWGGDWATSKDWQHFSASGR